MEDLFGEKRIVIKGDSYLNKIAQQIYDLVIRDSNLIKGNSMNQINRQVHYAIMLDSGLSNIILDINTKSTDKLENFKAWYLSKEYPTEEETARALRGLVDADLIRLSKDVLVKSEQFRQRIASKMR